MGTKKRRFGRIYGLVDADTLELLYIGQTADWDRRRQQHLRNYPNLRTIVLEVCEYNSLNEAERRWIREMKAKGARLRNRTDGGRVGHLGIKRSPETKAKLRKARQRQVPPMLGRNHSDQTKAKMRINYGMRSPEVRARVSAAQRGRIVPDERRARISATLTGRKHGPRSFGTGARISAGLKRFHAERKAKNGS